jgi:hypothetical protein
MGAWLWRVSDNELDLDDDGDPPHSIGNVYELVAALCSRLMRSQSTSSLRGWTEVGTRSPEKPIISLNAGDITCAYHAEKFP